MPDSLIAARFLRIPEAVHKEGQYMSAQTLNIMLSDLFRSEEALGQFQQDPDTVSAKYGLSDEEPSPLLQRFLPSCSPFLIRVLHTQS